MKLSTALTLLLSSFAPLSSLANGGDTCVIYPVVMDGSGSIERREQEWLRLNAMPALLAATEALTDVDKAFVCGAEYGRMSSEEIQLTPNFKSCASGAQAVAAAGPIDFIEKGVGSFEDGYDAMKFMADKIVAFIDQADPNSPGFVPSSPFVGCQNIFCLMILVTDEDRDRNDSTPISPNSMFGVGDFAGITQYLNDRQFVLNVITDVKVTKNGANNPNNVGAIHDGTIIRATNDAGTDYTIENGNADPLLNLEQFEDPPDVEIIRDYANVAFGTKGAVWNLRKLRQEGTGPLVDPKFSDAFVGSFVDVKVEELDDKLNKNATGGGDPHFSTWSGEKFSYHGECDLVLIQDPAFEQDLGLYVHGRTKIHKSWSAFEGAAIKIGDDVFEVHGKDEYWLNGEPMVDLPAKVGGKQIVMKASSEHISRYDITIHPGTKIILKAYDDFVWVSVEGPTHFFDGSTGLMGTYNGRMLARDGKTIMTEPNEFGQEWQVRDTDLQLFHNAEGPQYPQKCLLPAHPKVNLEEAMRLGGSAHVEAAKKACDHVGAHQKDDCIADVLATNDLAMASAY